MREFVRKWYERIPPSERHLPLVILGNKAYSPERVLREVEAGTPLGTALQKKLESGKFTTEEQLRRLAKIRLLEILKNLPPEYGFANYSGEIISKKELMKLIEKGEGLGEELIKTEIERIRRFLRA